MHPIFSSALESFTNELSAASLEDLQVSPGVGMHRWCGQQIVEHLLMTIERSKVEIDRRLASPRQPMTSRSLIQRIIKAALFWFGTMPRGVLAPRSLHPYQWIPADGRALASRLTVASCQLDNLLVVARRVYGMEPCGEHHIYGPLRVEEWRAYHAKHIRHHLVQLRSALVFSRSQLHLVEFNVGASDPLKIAAQLTSARLGVKH